jgi:hypothetical protein
MVPTKMVSYQTGPKRDPTVQRNTRAF